MRKRAWQKLKLKEKYNIYTATNGEDALKLLMEEPVQLVISDVMMPVMDGFEFCRIIKSNFEYSHIHQALSSHVFQIHKK